MTVFDKAMIAALREDAEKLSALTGEPQCFMVTCDDCGGEGGFETVEAPSSKWADPTPGGEWIECRTCGGTGWIESDIPDAGIDQDELPPPREDGGRP